MGVTSILQWLWARIDILAGIFVIPWGFFAISMALAGLSRFLRTSGSDIYVILCSLDLEFLMFHDRFINDVYPGIKPKFETVFGIGLVVSFLFLVLSSRVQHQIDDHPKATEPGYPSGGLFCCWAFGLSWMAGHFAAILIR